MHVGWWCVRRCHPERNCHPERSEGSCSDMSDRRDVPGSMKRSLVASLLGMTVPLRMTAPLRMTDKLLCAVLALSACGRSAAAKAEEARTKLRSWDATMELVERERASGAVPEQFAAQVRRAAQQDRQKAEAQLRKAGR